MKKKILACLLILILAAGCGVSAVLLLQNKNESTAETGDEQTVISLAQDGTTISGSGASISENTVTITAGGSYLISGTLSEGQIKVDAGDEDEVELILADVDIVNSADAAIYVENAKLTTVTLQDDTENRLQSGTTMQEASEEASGAALYARDDLAIAGNGSLTVLGYINNGIHTSNNLTISGGDITVESANNGINGKDSVTITGGSFKIQSGGDGIQSDDTTGEGYGQIVISGGTFDIESDGDAIQAETLLDISGGEFSIATGDGASAAVHTEDYGWGRPDAGWDQEAEDTVSMKAFKSGTALKISGGTFTVDAEDDAFHTNGDMTIAGGTFSIQTGDDGMHADDTLTVQDGTISILTCYEGLEGNQISVTGGDIDVVSTDDGMNAYGGQSNMGWGGSSKTTEETPNLIISGGTIHISAQGDGLDSNGNLIVEGGTVIVDGPTDSMNGALDSGSENGGSCTVSGGTVLALGSAGMAETFDADSEQCSFRYNLTKAYEVGDILTLTDSNGNVLYEYTIQKRGSSVVFSSADLKLGETYTLQVGEESYEIEMTSVSTTYGRGGFGW